MLSRSGVPGLDSRSFREGRAESKKGRGKLDKENKKGKACWLSDEWSEVYDFTTRLCGK